MGEEVVVGVGFDGLGEGWCPHHNDKEDDTSGEQINFMGMVGLLQVDFWSHIGFCTKLGLVL